MPSAAAFLRCCEVLLFVQIFGVPNDEQIPSRSGAAIMANKHWDTALTDELVNLHGWTYVCTFFCKWLCTYPTCRYAVHKTRRTFLIPTSNMHFQRVGENWKFIYGPGWSKTDHKEAPKKFRSGLLTRRIFCPTQNAPPTDQPTFVDLQGAHTWTFSIINGIR